MGLLLSVAALVMALAALVMALPAVLPVANIALSFMGAAVGVAGMQRDRNEGIVATVIGIIAGIINAIWLTFYFYESMQMPL